jgi:molybdate transport system substrate-binding protein
LPGDKHYVDQAAELGFIAFQEPVSFFVPTILVAKGNPKNIQSLDDLAKPGIKLGLGDSKACAIGRKSKLIFEKNDMDFAEIEKNLKFKSLTVNELGMQIRAGSLDAVIVWDAVANYYAEHADQVPIPVENNVISTVEIGLLEFAKNRKGAEEFVDFIVSEAGQDIFRKYNYQTEHP